MKCAGLSTIEQVGCRDRRGRKVYAEFVNRLLRLTPLAPDIQEAIFDGRQPKAMQLEELTRTMPSGWEEQRAPARGR